MPNEIIITVGLPGSGKSTFVKALTDQGYTRINRDQVGGGISDVNEPSYQYLRALYQQGIRSFILDNTYVTKEQRAVVMAVAKTVGLPVRVLWLQTTIDQAQFLVSLRQVRQYGRLLRPSEYAAAKNDPNTFPPGVQYNFQKRLEEPTLDEGFSAVEKVPLKITLDPQVYCNKAVIFDYDGTLRLTKSGRIYPSDPSDVQVLPGRTAKLAALQAQGYLLLGASNQSGISKKPGEEKYVSEADAIRCFEETNRQLGCQIDYLYASDPAGVPQSFWRKPMPGMGVVFIEKYKLDPSQVIFVGDLKTDKTFADRCGFQFRLAEDFFA